MRLWLIAVFILLAAQAQAVTKTVCASGCDYTELATAYAALSCGDVIQMKEPSTAGSLSYLLNKACTAGSTFTIEAFSGVNPVFNDTDSRWNSGLFYVTGDYHVLDGLTVNGTKHGNGVNLSGDHNTIQNMIFGNISTDDYPAGQNASAVMVDGGSFNIIQNSTFGDGCDHDAIQLGGTGGGYNKVLNNDITCDHGHAVAIGTSNYNLVDGNRAHYLGDLCVGAGCAGKQFLQISGGSNNSIRRNVAYDLYNRAIELDVLNQSGPNANNNLIYNNTFYNITTRGSSGNNDTVHLGTNDDSVVENCNNNVFTNNIFDKVAQQGYADASNHNIALMFYYTVENDLGDDLTELSTTYDWRGNWFKNNVIRVYYSGSYQPDAPYAVTYANSPPPSYVPTFTISAFNGVGSQAGNITTDPEFVSTNTGIANWWHLQGTSDLIDGGLAVTDTNGSYVESNYPGFGWSSLTYGGAAPDIGAFEAGVSDKTVTVGVGSQTITLGAGTVTVVIP